MLCAIVSLVIAISGFQGPASSAGPTVADTEKLALTAQEISEIQAGAAKGNPLAELRLARAYSVGNGVVKSAETAVEWYRKAWTAADGYKDIVGLYSKGGLLGENPAQATRWLLMAAQGGDPDSQLAAADILLNGRGVPQDFVGGRHWCEQATKVDDQRGFYCLGEIYRRGLGVKRDPKLARTWYERSGRQRNPAAIRALAEMDVAGEGEKPNRESACVRYAALVMSIGDKDDELKLAALKKQMDPKEWEKVRHQLVLMKIDPAKLDIALQQVENR